MSSLSILRGSTELEVEAYADRIDLQLDQDINDCYGSYCSMALDKDSAIRLKDYLSKWLSRED